MIQEENKTEVHEYVVLEKFEGEAVEENLIERLHIEQGEIVKVEKFENGELVSSEDVTESGNFTGDTTK